MKDKIIALIDKEVPLIYREGLKALIRPTIRVMTGKRFDSSIPMGSSKFGGVPHLPAGMEWPCSQTDQQDYRFVAQFNLADVALYDEEASLPKAGMLYFFVDDSNLGKVIYSDLPTDKLVLSELPESFRPKEKSFFQKIFSFNSPQYIQEECQVEFKREYSLPDSASIYIDILKEQFKGQAGVDDDFYPEDFIEALDKITKPRDNDADHHLLGHIQPMQSSSKEWEVAFPGQREKVKFTQEETKVLTEWILLFQLDSDETAGTVWGDSGRSYLLIRKEALKNGDFSDVRATMDCC